MIAYTKHYVTIPDGQVHYARTEGEGIPIVFVHKTVSTFRMWLPVMSRMPEGGPAMFAFDTPGFGESFDPAEPVPISQYAAWIGEAVAALGIEKYHLVGHHTGACVALDLAVQRPDNIASLTLLGPVPLTAEERAERSKIFGPPFTPNASGSYLIDTWAYCAWAGAAVDPLLMNREMSAMLRSYQTRSWTYGAVWQQGFLSLYKTVAAPLLIMCSPDDVLFPFWERAKTLRPDATAVLLPEGGKNYQTDLVPDEIASALAHHVARNARVSGR